MSLKEWFDSMEDSAFPTTNDGIGIDYSLKGIGFGQLYFYVDADQKLHCDNECMSPDMVKRILNIMVDTCIMDDEWRKQNESSD